MEELLSRFGDDAGAIAPRFGARGAAGHAWEQLILPGRVGNRVLWSPSGSGPLAVRRQVITVHDMVPFDVPESVNPRFSAWYRWLLPRLVHRVAAVITVSHFTKERLVSITGLPESRVMVVHNAVDGRFSRQPAEEIARVRRQLGIRSQSYMLSLGTVEPRKNLALLLNAWRRSIERIPDDLVLVLAGSIGPSRTFRAAGLGPLPPRVQAIGYVPDDCLPALYSGALGLVYPSLYEGFGLPPLEAMACGCPVIVSDVASLPEVCGDSALYCDPRREEDIGDRISSLVGDAALRENLRRKGLARAKSFTWDDTARRTHAVIAGLLR